MRLLKALDRNRRVTAVPFQKSGVPASVGLTLKECEASAWAIASDGGRYRGAEAVNTLVAAAMGTAIPLHLYYLPGIRQVQDFIYPLIASNRSRLPGDRPYCVQHPAECRQHFSEEVVRDRELPQSRGENLFTLLPRR